MNPDDIVFRDFRPADIEAVIAVFRTNIPKYFVPPEEQELRDYLAKHPEEYFVMEASARVIGAGGIALNEDRTVSLCWGMVRNDLLGTGLGRKLTEFRIEEARKQFGELPFVISTSQHTQGFYEKLGFALIEHTPDGFGPGIDICKMRKESQP